MTCSFFCIQVWFFLCIFITTAVFYLSTGLVECSVNSKISRGARKLTWTSRVIKKEKKKKTSRLYIFVVYTLFYYVNFVWHIKKILKNLMDFYTERDIMWVICNHLIVLLAKINKEFNLRPVNTWRLMEIKIKYQLKCSL